MKTSQKTFFAAVALILLSALLSGAKAATITSSTLDRDIYYQGETGYILLTVYNDKDNKIRVFEITAEIDYFYADGTVYMQTFFTNATLPIEIPQGQSHTFHIPFSLPTNIAPGYTRFTILVKTELWNAAVQRWFQSDRPTAKPLTYIESPYKKQFEQQQAINEKLKGELQNLQTSYNTITLVAFMLTAIAIALGIAMALIMRLTMKPRAAPQPPPP